MNNFNALLCFILTITVVSSWWDKGHMLVSQIAYNHLTNTNRQLQRQKFDSLVKALNPFTDGKSNSFAQAAVWADDIKSYGAKFFDNYHFTNIVYDPDFTFKGMTQYQQDVNAVNIINWCMTVLKSNKDSNSFERAFMARYLLHLVGDIHQPLHSTMMFNNTYKNGDQGGNLISIITLGGKSFNLHSYFDSIALDQDPDIGIIRPLNDSYRKVLQDKAVQVMKKYPAQSLSNYTIIKDAHAWGVQAFQIAVDKIYSYTKIHKNITEQYQSQMRDILYKQIAIGGYRLADYISDIYA